MIGNNLIDRPWKDLLRTPGFYVGIEALYHTSRTRHQALPTDNLTYMRTLAQNDPLEWTRRIGRLDPTTTRGRTSHSRKCRRHGASSCLRPHRDPLRPPTLRHRLSASHTAAASASRASSESSSSTTAVSTWACMNGKSPSPAGSARSVGDARRFPCCRRCRACNFVKQICAVDGARRESTRALGPLRKGARMGCARKERACCAASTQSMPAPSAGAPSARIITSRASPRHSWSFRPCGGAGDE